MPFLLAHFVFTRGGLAGGRLYILEVWVVDESVSPII